MQVIISNRLEILAEELKKRLFQKSRHPFGQRTVIVPNQRILQELYFRIASDEQLQVATGFQMMTWREAISQIFPSIPSSLELSLKIEGMKLDLPYLKEGGASRLASFSEKMSGLFLHYMTQDKVIAWLDGSGWQQELWRAVFGGELPWKRRQLLEGEVYLFHPCQMASYQLRAFQEMGAAVFLFSPCEMYWGDLKTVRERRFFQNEDMKEYFSEDHPLLSNWGKAGRELGKLFEDEEMVEAYHSPSGQSLLKALQQEMLTLEVLDKPVDDSIQIHAVSSKIREVEVVWEIIQTLPFEPQDILVLAPEMQSYGALVEMIFRERGGSYDFAIFCLDAMTKSPLMQGLQNLIDLPKYRFSKKRVQRLLFSPLFLKKFGFDRDEVQLLQRWMSQVQIRYDVKGDHPCTWEAGLKRVVEALVLPAREGRLVLDFSQADLLSRWIGVIKLFSEELGVLDQEMSLGDWIRKVRSWMEIFFDADPDDELMRQLHRFQKISIEGVFPFSTMERLLHEFFHQKSGSVHAPHLQAVRFASLEKGALIPAKAIILMGMDETAFPRSDAPSSLTQLRGLSRNEEDRYLFLEAVCSAREQFIVTYPCIHSEDGKAQLASSLVEELRRYLNLGVIEHPPVARPKVERPQTMLQLPPLQIPAWEMAQLRLLARHPLQFFFEERVGIDFDWKEQETEFILSPLELSRLRKGSLKKNLDTLLSEMKEEGKLPVRRFSEVAIRKIQGEIQDYHEKLAALQVKEVYAVELKVGCQSSIQLEDGTWIYPALHVGDVVIQGRIEGLSSQGLLFHGDDSLADLLKVWPMYLVAEKLFPRIPLLLTKKGKRCEISAQKDALERYLSYAKKALQTPSPLFPKWARSIFTEGKIPPIDEHDSVIEWVKTRDLLPPEAVWINEWNPYLQEVFRELL